MEHLGLSAEEAVEEHGGNGSEALSGTESRRDLPVCFRCGKCWLPIDSIRASSGLKKKKKGGAGIWS